MCGIVAAAGFPVDQGKRAEALSRLHHRGPDDRGDWLSVDGTVWLGHRRLSIIDLSAAGHQPLSNEDDSVHLACNGEIYNAVGLRRELKSLGHRFRSRSDNEVIIHAYEQWGVGSLARLEGMFAFVIWDDNARRMFVARDRLGIKPLFYSVTSAGLIVGSELAAIRAIAPELARPDPVALGYVMTLGYVPSPFSMFEGIRKLEAGQFAEWDSRGFRLQRYWTAPDGDNIGADALAGDWAELFETVVQQHMTSDVPVGLFLSGGRDSSAVAAAMANNHTDITALTVGFPGSPRDESAAAQETAAALGFRHNVIPMHINDSLALASTVAGKFDEPQGYSALLSMFMVSQAAADSDLRVVMAGDGADELFGGYAWYQDLDYTPRTHKRLLRAGSRWMAGKLSTPATLRRAIADFSECSVLHRHARRLFPRFLPEEVASILSPMTVVFDDELMLEPLREHYDSRLPVRLALQRVDLLTFCSDSILQKVDRASMGHSVEVRVPFLDHRLVEWAFRHEYGHGHLNDPKNAISQYLAGRVPADVLSRPKQGFSVPVLDTFDWDAALEIIRAGFWVTQGYWNPAWEKHVHPGIPYRNARIWILLMLTLWANQHLQ